MPHPGDGLPLFLTATAVTNLYPFFAHFLFRTQKYIEALTSKTKPKKILVCMIYYPDENNVPSWANAVLGALGYNTNPAKIQLLIRKFFEEATRYVFPVHVVSQSNTLVLF